MSKEREQRYAVDPAGISFEKPSLADVLSIAGASGLEHAQQMERLQEAIDKGVLKGAALDVLKSEGLV